jgi:prophage maintenance system killer protein
MLCKSEIEIFRTSSGTEIQVTLDQDTVWLTQAQIVALFDSSKANINEHIKHIFESQELLQEATVRNFRTVQKEGSRDVSRSRNHYNLDVIISVGYRVNTKQGVLFRQWATQRLNEYLVHGYSINKKRFEQNANELEQALKLIQKTAQSPELNTDSGRGLIEIFSCYTKTFLWLQRYDDGLLEEPEGQSGGSLPTPDEGMRALTELKQQLAERGEATDLFARPRLDGLEGIFGNLNQTVFGEPAYPTIESKAAHLLYFVVKNHPFSDGNKRSGAFLFVDFLHRNDRLFSRQDVPVINDTGLAALTLLVAESDPKQKETIIRLVMNLLSRTET